MTTTQDKLNELVNKTIASIEIIKPEDYYMTYLDYICITFQDKTKLLLRGRIPHNPDPSEEEMKKAPKFFTPEDIASKVLRDEKENKNI